MKIILYFFISFLLYSCVQHKELSVSEKIKIESDSLIVNEEKEIIDSTNEIVSEMKIIRKEEFNNTDDKTQIKLIENHEKKTKLKVIDKSIVKNDVSDTNSGWIAYSVPNNMKVAKSYSVKVRISKKTNGQNKAVLILGDDDAINNTDYESIATIEDIKVSGEMSA